MHRIAEVMTRARVGGSAWPTAGAIKLLASKQARQARESGGDTPSDVAVALAHEGNMPSSQPSVDGAEGASGPAGMDLCVHQLADTIRRLSQEQRDSLIGML